MFYLAAQTENLEDGSYPKRISAKYLEGEEKILSIQLKNLHKSLEY